MSAKTYKGNKPEDPRWSQIGEFEDDVRWFVFVRENDDSPWLSVKVVADGRAKKKGNYWLGWNGSRFAQRSDVNPLMSQRPNLYGYVEALMSAYDLL